MTTSVRDGLIDSLRWLKGQRVIAAMSGGVDSSLVAALLKEAEADVLGVFLHVWDYSREDSCRQGSCCATEDAYDARRVADQLGIPFYVMDMQSVFRRHVIDPFIADYSSGRTPNPCERCNRFVKFGALLETADQLDAPWIATGHYVQRQDDADGMHIFRGADDNKDQTYFLATCSKPQLQRILFPLGGLQKDETRRQAVEFGLKTATKHESQDICFIPAGDRVAFLRQQGADQGFVAGDIVDEQGSVLGKHQGIAHYTLGQRRGLGLPGGPWHVVALDGTLARVVVAPPQQAMIRGVEVADMQWLCEPPKVGVSLLLRVRYRMRPAPCQLQGREDGKLRLMFDEPQKPTAPGQVAAVYQGRELLGGGIVSESIR